MEGETMPLLQSKRNKLLAGAALIILSAPLALAGATWASLKPIDRSLREISSNVQTIRIADRNGEPLDVSYKNQWNSYDFVPLYEMPDLLKTAFVMSEDRKFYEHHGMDWEARSSALWQNVRSLHAVRGASTITEQVVRMVNPRPRTIWSRWLEGFEALDLEQKVSKADILEFYLNQVPYAANRRGIVQASRYYFDRDLATLTPKEMIALVVLVRAPSSYDLYKNPGRIEGAVRRLAGHLQKDGKIDENHAEAIRNEKLDLKPSALSVEARHFARYVRLSSLSPSGNQYRTTLDASLQKQTQAILDARISALRKKNVHNAAALVADYQTGEILAWVVAGAKEKGGKTPSTEIDTVTTPRQPGSSMKPFLYARALDKGWTAATIIDDSPLAEAVGSGLHNFRNYSNVYYGPVSLREALGNSLNIPALRTIGYVGVGDYLSTLKKMRFESLTEASGVYEEGLALGNGAVTLLEMAQAYAALANHGIYRPFHVLMQQHEDAPAVRVYSDETASLIGNILSDRWARRMEFGAGSVLNFPVQTAAKTGTSTDYRDAWTLAYNDRYVVGIWMGNLDNQPMKEVTGAAGPALALRGIFAILNEGRDTSPLYLSQRLAHKDVCIRPANEKGECPMRTEWFAPGTEPLDYKMTEVKKQGIELVRPTEGLQIAYDPRIPKENQKFRFELEGVKSGQNISWYLDDGTFAKGTDTTVLWPVERGKHVLSVEIEGQDGTKQLTPVNFIVK